MGEIKSTLDLVMERTRHLSMSAEEKTRQRQADFAKRLQGLLQQYADGAMAVDRLRDRINALQAELSVTDQEPVLTAIMERIDPEKDNQPWLTLLVDLAPAIGGLLDEIFTAFQREKADLWLASIKRLHEALWQQHGIKGSAVVPNPSADTAFIEQLAKLRQQTHARVDDLLRQNR